MGQKGVTFGPVLTDRVIQMVRRVGDTPYRVTGSESTPVLEDWSQGGSPTMFRICTFTGAWSKSTDKVVTYKYQTATPNTVLVTNLFAEIITTSQSIRNCAIAKEGTAWFLIAAEC